jgi:uncharacterized protein (DUF983 family)
MKGGPVPPFSFEAGALRKPAGRRAAVEADADRKDNVVPQAEVPSPTTVALKGCCPRCGKGRLFRGFLALAPRCESCGLDYAFIDTADGPAFFVMSFVGVVVVGLALWVEFAYEPPIWLHIVMWFALTAILSLALVRPSKALMVALQFRHKAEEGRLER